MHNRFLIKNQFSEKIMKKFISAAISIPLLTACASAHRVPPIFTQANTKDIISNNCVDCGFNPVTWVQRLSEAPIQQINPYKYQSYYETASTGSSTCTAANRMLGTKEQARNNLLSVSIRLAEASTSEHLSAIKATETNMNLLLGAATAGLTGGASVAATAEGAKVLSAAATGTNAGRAMFNETTYRNALGETLVSSIETAQDLERIGLVQKMTWCIDEYPVELALADVQKYLENGSFYHGLALIRTAAEEKNSSVKDSAEKKVEVLFENREKEALEPAKQARIKSLLDKIGSIDPKAATTLAANPPINDEKVNKVVKLIDPNDDAKRDPIIARKILKMRVTLDKRNDESLEKWDAAVSSTQ
jgi:hypothetical protein